MRAPIQVLIFPYRKTGDKLEYVILKRKDMAIWQGIAGGGEDQEEPLTAAKREAFEELNISRDAQFIRLDTTCSIPACHFNEYKKLWGEDTYVVKEFSFGVEASKENFVISHEHTEYKWCSYEEAQELLRYDSNKTALWELNERLK